MTLRVEFIGIAATQRALNAGLKREVARLARDVHQSLRQHTPVRTGRARGGWRTTTTDTTFVSENRVPYVGYLDTGTPKMKPANRGHGIVTPAIQKVRGKN
jgi:hypothetical protein